MKTEIWNGHIIRFVEVNDEWWAVAVDVCSALGLEQVTRAIATLKDGVTISKVIDSLGREQEVNILNEKSIYKLVFKSRKREAEEFQDWVFEVVRELRRKTGFEGFEVFRMLDKEHQKEAMKKLQEGLHDPIKIDYIKANTISNKAVSTKFGHKKMIKKSEMTPQMLTNREEILNDTVELMSVKDKFSLDLSISNEIYKKHSMQ